MPLEKWSTDSLILATLTRAKIPKELELLRRMVPGTQKPALKPQLAALLAKVRETQKLRSSEFKPPPKPHVASQKAQKLLRQQARPRMF